jgi:hypothetical protein
MKIIYYAGVNIYIFVRKQYFLSALFPEKNTFHPSDRVPYLCCGTELQ